MIPRNITTTPLTLHILQHSDVAHKFPPPDHLPYLRPPSYVTPIINHTKNPPLTFHRNIHLTTTYTPHTPHIPFATAMTPLHTPSTIHPVVNHMTPNTNIDSIHKPILVSTHTLHTLPTTSYAYSAMLTHTNPLHYTHNTYVVSPVPTNAANNLTLQHHSPDTITPIPPPTPLPHLFQR